MAAPDARPHLRLVRLARSGQDVICLFVNDGASASHLQVTATDCRRATIDPIALVPQSTGHVRLVEVDAAVLSVDLRYLDAAGTPRTDTYRLDTHGPTLQRLDTPVEEVEALPVDERSHVYRHRPIWRSPMSHHASGPLAGSYRHTRLW